MLDPMGDRTLTDLLSEQAAAYADRTFLVFEDRGGAITKLTYGEFHERSERCAAGLHRLGVTKGDFVVVHLFNCPEFLIAWFALARLGATLVPSNVANTATELEHILGVTNARLVVTETALLDAVSGALEATGAEAGVVVVDGSEEVHIPFDELSSGAAQAPDVTVGSTTSPR